MTLPGVVLLSGSVITTGSPTLMLDCCAASSAIVTTRRVDVIPSTGPACTAAPSVGVTLVTRTGPGSKTTEPSASVAGPRQPAGRLERVDRRSRSRW